MTVTIRDERATDVVAIEAVTVLAFLSAPHTSHTEERIVNCLRQAGKLALSLIAQADGTVIGHIAISPVSISDGAASWFGMGPVSVRPEHQRRGVGSRLVREALRLLRARGAAGCVVLGEPEYYGRFGFKADPGLVLRGVPPEYFQALAFGPRRPKGIVTYHEAFNAQEPTGAIGRP